MFRPDARTDITPTLETQHWKASIQATQLIDWWPRWFPLVKGSTHQNAPSHYVSAPSRYGGEDGETREKVLTKFCLMLFGTRRIGHVANLLVRFALASDKGVSAGWAPRTLVQCGVAYPEIWDILHGMYESQVKFILSIYPSLSLGAFHHSSGLVCMNL